MQEETFRQILEEGSMRELSVVGFGAQKEPQVSMGVPKRNEFFLSIIVIY